MEKICTICKDKKDIKEYNKNRAKKDGYNTICRACSNKRSKQYYSEKGEQHRVAVLSRKKVVRKNNQEKFLVILKKSICVDCGTKDYRVLEFDHIEDNKRRDVSQLLSTAYKWEAIEQEMKKCDIVCCNCHRIRTMERAGSYRLK